MSLLGVWNWSETGLKLVWNHHMSLQLWPGRVSQSYRSLPTKPMTIIDFETKMIFVNSRFSPGAFLSSGFHCKHNFLFFLVPWSSSYANVGESHVRSFPAHLLHRRQAADWHFDAEVAKAQAAAAGAWAWNGGLDRFFPLIRNDISSAAKL